MMRSPLAVLVLLCASAVAADVSVSGSVDASRLDATGRFVLRLAFELGEQPLQEVYRVRVRVYSAGLELFDRDHAPPVPSTEWPAGESFRYELPSLFPLASVGSDLAGDLDVFVGLVDVAANEPVFPGGEGRKKGDMRWVASFPAPTATDELSAAAEETAQQTAKELKAAEQPAEAWDVLELALRRSRDYEQKKRLRKAMEALGHFAPRPLTREEEGIVAARIRGEKVRYLREVAGRLNDRKMEKGALAILDKVGGFLREDAQAAAIGAVNEVDRNTRSADGIRLELLRRSITADEELIASMRPLPTWESAAKMRATAEKLMQQGHFGAAYEIASRAAFSKVSAVALDALLLKAEVRLRVGQGMTEEEEEAVAAAENHPAWERLMWAPSHEFIYIGPRDLITGLMRNRESTRRFDLSYVFQTDLFGRTPNPGGDRLTVFFKELWDFNGGVGGGKIIDIGNAKPENRSQRVDNGLLYHELTHNVYDVVPGYPGFTEGIANFGAVFSHDVLDQNADSLHSFQTNLDAFRDDYVGRDLEFWRIQNYGPSAGFFLHFIDRHGRDGKQLNWTLYRDFFREYNGTPLRDGRPHGAIRAIAHYLVRAFGGKAFDDLVQFRFPLTDTDREAIEAEVAAGDGNTPAWASTGRGHDLYPNSPALQDHLYHVLASLRNGGDFEQTKEFCEGELGILYRWRVGGPFLANSGGSFAEVFVPEHGVIDFDARYDYGKHTALWRKPSQQEGDYVIGHGDGWVQMDYPYPNGVSAYAYCRLKVPTAREAILHLRTDDHSTLWVNGKLLAKMKNIGAKGSARLPWRGRRVPDELRVPVRLEAGANTVLLKVTNGTGSMGFVVAVTDAAGRPMPDLETDTSSPSQDSAAVAEKRKPGKPLVFEERKMRHVKATVGGFTLKRRNGKQSLVGTDTDGKVQWRKYTVRPGVKKDSPSNLGWLPADATKDLGDFQLELELASQELRLPKFLVTFEGDGKEDGLSGWTVILVPDGKSLHARVERYDDLYFRSWNHEVEPARGYRLVLQRIAGQFTLRLDDLELIPPIDVPRLDSPGSDRVGLATWDTELGVATITLRR